MILSKINWLWKDVIEGVHYEICIQFIYLCVRKPISWGFSHPLCQRLFITIGVNPLLCPVKWTCGLNLPALQTVWAWWIPRDILLGTSFFLFIRVFKMEFYTRLICTKGSRENRKYHFWSTANLPLRIESTKMPIWCMSPEVPRDCWLSSPKQAPSETSTNGVPEGSENLGSKESDFWEAARKSSN